MSLAFDKNRVLNLVVQAVDRGLDSHAVKIKGLARSLAPVRKTKPRQRGRNRSIMRVGLFYKGTQYRASLKTVAEGIPFYKPTKIGQDERRSDDEILVDLKKRMEEMGLEARPRPRRGETVSQIARNDISRLANVHITSAGLFYGGRLRNSIVTYSKNRGKLRRGRIIHARAPYARWVEFPTHREKRGSTKAQPFMLPAVKTHWSSRKLGEIGKSMRIG